MAGLDPSAPHHEQPSQPAASPFDIADREWDRIAAVIPFPRAGGRPRTIDMRGVVNALLALEHRYYKWRDLPERYPNASSVRYYYDRWRRDGTWEQICGLLGLAAEE
jgi:putative transposase